MTAAAWESAPGRTYRLADGDLHVYETGRSDGPPVLLLHGFLTSAWTWRAVYPVLAEQHRVILLDLPGSGRSPAAPSRLRTASQTADLLINLFDELGLVAPAVVGSQMGGSLAAWLAAHHPERVSRLVIMAAGALGETSENLGLYRGLAMPVLGPLLAKSLPKRVFAQRWAAAHSHEHPPGVDAIEVYHRQFRVRGSEMARFGLGVRLSYGESFDTLKKPLSKVEIPTLLMFGSVDPLVPPDTGKRFADVVPGSQLVMLPGCGDFPQEEMPDSVAATVLDFLSDFSLRESMREV